MINDEDNHETMMIKCESSDKKNH